MVQGLYRSKLAIIGHNIAPGFNRDFVCETWDWMPAGLSEELRAKAEQEANYDIELDICGYDIDGKMIEIAKQNAYGSWIIP